MTEPFAYDIELKGNVGSRSLRPLIDDFSIDRSEEGVTRLAGKIQDPSHLHGVVLHLASMNIEIISIVPAHSQDVRHETSEKPQFPEEAPTSGRHPVIGVGRPILRMR